LLVWFASAFSSVAIANTITQSLAFRLNPDVGSSVLSFNPFELSLGTLDSVEISFNATRRHDWAAWNISGQPADVAYNAALTGTTLTLGGNVFGFADLVYGAGTTGLLGSVSLPTFFTEAQMGRTQFIAGQDPVYASGFSPATVSTLNSGLYSFLGFGGELALSYDPGIETISASNFLTTSLVDVAGTVTVTYNYRVVSVPDSSLGLLLPAGLLGLFLVARSRRVELKQAS